MHDSLRNAFRDDGAVLVKGALSGPELVPPPQTSCRIMADLTRLPGNAALDDVIAVMDRDGGVIVHDFVTETLLAELKADLLPKIATCATGRMYLALGPEVVKSYPEHVQRLLGWSYTPETFMGWVEIDGDMADPFDCSADARIIAACASSRFSSR